jgi:hypothetical protein
MDSFEQSNTEFEIEIKDTIYIKSESKKRKSHSETPQEISEVHQELSNLKMYIQNEMTQLRSSIEMFQNAATEKRNKTEHLKQIVLELQTAKFNADPKGPYGSLDISRQVSLYLLTNIISSIFMLQNLRSACHQLDRVIANKLIDQKQLVLENRALQQRLTSIKKITEVKFLHYLSNLGSMRDSVSFVKKSRKTAYSSHANISPVVQLAHLVLRIVPYVELQLRHLSRYFCKFN